MCRRARAVPSGAVRTFLSATLLLPCLALLPACLPGVETPVAASDAAADAGGPACRPILTGEPVINELLVRPGGVDLDGDGASTSRDEAIELWLDTEAEAHLGGVRLRVDGKERGAVPLATCLPRGTVVVLTSSTTADLALPPGAVQVRLDHPLKLPDGGGHVALLGLAGTVLAEASWGAEPPGQPSSLARLVDGDRSAAFGRHRELADTGGEPCSFGRCLSGLPPCACFASQGMACGDVRGAAVPRP